MVYLGEIVNTHGIKGELRIISDFKYKDKAFKINNKLYLGKRLEEVIIKSYRKHKNYDMVTFDGINDINDAIRFKTDSVYIKREDLDITGYVDEDIISIDAYVNDIFVGKVINILKGKQDILVIEKDKKTSLVPFVNEIVQVDLKNKKINIEDIEGLINEN